MKVLICNPDQKEINGIKKRLQKFSSVHGVHFEISAYTTPIDVLAEKTQYDIAVLSSDMPDINGITLAKVLIKEKMKTKFIFISDTKRYLGEAFRLNAAGYLINPYGDDEFDFALQTALLKISKVRIYVDTNGTRKRLCLDKSDIYYFENQSRCVKIVTEQGELFAAKPFSDYKNILSDISFAVPHNSYIVNLAHIKECCRNKSIKMENGDEITITRSKSKEFNERYIKFTNLNAISKR